MKQRWTIKEWLWFYAIFLTVETGGAAINKWIVHLPGFPRW